MTAGAAGKGRSMPAFGNELTTRVVSALVLAAVALVAAWFGGWVAFAGTAAAVVVVEMEWTALTGDARPFALTFGAGLVVALLVATGGFFAVGIGVATVVVVLAFVSKREVWRPLGVVYAGLLGFGVLAICLAAEGHRAAIFFLFAVVWATDTGAYFAGRAIGGAKLWPKVSPNKTRAGAVGGVVAGTAAGVVLALVAGYAVNAALAGVAIALSIAAELGDLFESWVKRRFGAKDSGHLIPGHGGLMDRIDGLIAAAALAALIGWANSGDAGVAVGLLAW